MFFNARSLSKAALLSYFALETSGLVLKPMPMATDVPVSQLPGPVKRNNGPKIDFRAVEDWGHMTGNFVRREISGHSVFDTTSERDFLYGAYAGDHFYKANFTLKAPADDELILPVEQFAKHLKSISCGQKGQPMVLAFNDQDSFQYAQKQWQWVNQKDINHFILVTEANQCFQGDDRSPYLVNKIKFNPSQLTAEISAEEKQWQEVATAFNLAVRAEHVDPSTANVTHPLFVRRDESKVDLHTDVNQKLFDFAKNSGETAGLALSADAHIQTGGYLVADFDVEFFIIPKDVNIKIHPQGVWGQMMLNLNADGTLGKPLDYTMKPEIEIPVAALNIKGLLELGPFVTFGVHFGSGAIQGTGTLSAGAKGTLKDSAEVNVKLRDPGKNSIKDWEPTFEKIDPTFSAEISGDFRAWGELGIKLKAEVLSKWGYQASVDAELPYFDAVMAAKVDSAGVCGSQKTKGVELSANVGINVHLDAGPAEGNPDFQKDLFDQKWPLYTTCIGVGADDVKTAEPTTTDMPTSTDSPSTATDETTATGTEDTTATETGGATATETGSGESTATETSQSESTATETAAAGPAETGDSSETTGTDTTATETTATETGGATATENGDSAPTGTDSVPTGTDSVPTGTDSVPTGTDSPTATTTDQSTATTTDSSAPNNTDGSETTTDMATITGPPMATGTGFLGTGTASGGWPVTANSTFLKMARRKPTALYL